MVEQRRAWLLLGGEWHNFSAFADYLRGLLIPMGWSVEPVWEFDRLLDLPRERPDLVAQYTCFTRTERGGGDPPDGLSEEQAEALAAWVASGGAFLPLHAASVVGSSAPRLAELIGAVFIEHPPLAKFTVYPLAGDHPMTRGVDNFSIQDELFHQACDPSNQVHLVAVDQGVAYPMAWSRPVGAGRVACLALGHAAAAWENLAYQRLLIQSVAWLVLAEEAPLPG